MGHHTPLMSNLLKVITHKGARVSLELDVAIVTTYPSRGRFSVETSKDLYGRAGLHGYVQFIMYIQTIGKGGEMRTGRK